jgi:hypothetical protein
MNRWTRIVGAILVAGLTGCATSPTLVAPETAARIKRVAPISVTADKFTRQYVGFTVFQNNGEEVPIADWGVDAEYEKQLALEIERMGMTAVRAPYPLGDFVHVNDLNGPYSAPAFWGPNWTKIEATARAYCAANSLDALVVVARQTTGDFLAGTNQAVSGAGIYSRGNPVRPITVMHLVSRVGLIDCATGKPLAVRTLARNQDPAPAAERQARPLLPVGDNVSRVPIGQWSPVLREQVRRDLIGLPQGVWADTLKSMFTAK